MSTKGGSVSKGEFYRQCRIWHGYLSAFAFLALLFFAATGILLNHPGLIKVTQPKGVEKSFILTPTAIGELRAANDPGPVLVLMARDHAKLAGRLKESQTVGDDIFVRMQGVRGSTDLRANLAEGKAEITVEPQHPIAIFNALHRAELAGDLWRYFVDVIAGVLIVMALIGYVLFLSLRFRLKTALAISVASFMLMVGLFVTVVS